MGHALGFGSSVKRELVVIVIRIVEALGGRVSEYNRFSNPAYTMQAIAPIFDSYANFPLVFRNDLAAIQRGSPKQTSRLMMQDGTHHSS